MAPELPDLDPVPAHRDPIAYSRATGRRVGIGAAVALAALAAGFVVVHHQRSSDAQELARATAEVATARPPVNVVRVRAGNGLESVTLPGATAAWNETTLYARVSGYVAKWKADIGDTVRAGQVLATIATPELDAELDAARAKLDADRAEVKVRESALEFARTTYERWRDSPKGVVSDQERESKKADFESASAQLRAAGSRVSLDRAEVERLTALTRFKNVTAPFDGTVTERRIDVGNLVTAGSTSSTTPLYRMAQDNPMRVFVDVPQGLVDAVTPGTPATVTLRRDATRKLSGKVARTARAVDPVARTLRVEVDLPNADGTIVSGLYVQVEFALASASLVQVPAAGVVFRSGGPQVAVVGADGAVAFRAVRIARDEGNVIELADGLQPGELVALNISSQIASGDKVDARLQDDAPKPAAAGTETRK